MFKYYKNIFLLTLLLIFSFSCVKRLTIVSPINELEQKELNEAYSELPARLHFINRIVLQTSHIVFMHDSLKYQNNNDFVYANYNNLEFIVLQDKKEGLKQGLKKGLMLGAVVGIVLGAASITFTSTETRTERALKGGLVLGFEWAAIGAFVGATKGAQTLIYIESPK